MASSFTWMAYAEAERRQVLDVITLLSERDTRDELGIGSVRDSLSDLLFPGTNVIQTRARYFLFISWVYLELERLRVPSRDVEMRARSAETALIEPLSHSDDTGGIIGIDARLSLKRLASNVYWLGLRRWGIRIFPGSQEQYHRSLDRFYAGARDGLRNDDGEPLDETGTINWHAGLPPIPRNFPQGVSFRLSRVEAEYLRERLMARAPGTLLTHLVDVGTAFEPVQFPWEHPLASELPRHLETQLEHARNFSEAMHGAVLLYNLMLGELSERRDREEHYRTALLDWAALVTRRRGMLATWDREDFWRTVTSAGYGIPLATRQFANRWLDVALSVGTSQRSVGVDADARELVCHRERFLKRDRSRLTNRRALEGWSGSAGDRQLAYRWATVQQIVLDILAGLRRGDSDA